MLANDFEAPTVSLTSPAAGAIVGGTVTLTATAADDIAVVGVQFKLDGTAIGGEDVDAPYEMSWATEPVSDGLHALTAVARDAAGRETVSTINVTVTHDVTAPTVAVTSPGDGTTIAGAVTVTAAAADDVGVVSVQLLMDGVPFGSPITAAPYETTWSTAGAANGTHTWSAVARDAAGHVTTASAVSVTVRNDLSAPTVGLSSPAAGATLAGIVTVTAAAADDIGVVSVQFLLDGAPLGAAVVAEPYQVEWSTTAAANGAHTLTAVAADAVGRETTAAAVIVNVINDTTAPTVALTSPSAGTTIGGTVLCHGDCRRRRRRDRRAVPARRCTAWCRRCRAPVRVRMVDDDRSQRRAHRDGGGPGRSRARGHGGHGECHRRERHRTADRRGDGPARRDDGERPRDADGGGFR